MAKKTNKKPVVNSRIVNGDKYLPTRLNAKYKGNHYYTQEYKIKQIPSGLGISTQDANFFVRDLLKRKRQVGALYQVSYKTASGLKIFSKFDETQVIPDFNQYGLEEGDFTITSIHINYIQASHTRGGYDPKFNDCLYKAVKFGLSDKADKYIKQPWLWKQWVGIERNDMIDYTTIPIIEDKIKCRINVVGDYEYHSPKPYSRVVQVKLENGHYEFKNNMSIRKDLIKFKNYKQKLVYYETCNEENKQNIPLLRFYDGIEIVEKRFKRCDLIKSKTEFYKENPDCEIPIKEAYDTFMNDCEHFKQLTAQDLNDYNHSITDLCLALWYKKALCYEFEPMDEYETATHLKCRRGGLMYADNTIQGEMNCFDINSSYPSVMIENSFPYTKPEYRIITEKPEFGWGMGLYHAKIHDIDKRLMTVAETDWYSSVDLKRADELGYKIELIQDDEFNALQYKKNITGNELFGSYINDMYIHKNTINPLTGKKNQIFKSVLNNLHGLLSQRDKRYYTNDDTSEPFETDKPIYVQIYERDGLMVTMSQASEFKRPQARLLTFITALARTKISKLVEPIKNDVYRIQTDSFLTTVDTIKTDNCLGGLKKEYSGEYSIEHVNKITCLKCGKSAKMCSVVGCC